MFHVKHCGKTARRLIRWQAMEWRGEALSRGEFSETC